MICHEFPISIWPGPCRWPVVTRFPFCRPSLTRREKLPSAFNPMMQPSVQHGLYTQYCLLLKSPPWSPLPARPWKPGTWVTSTSTSPLSPRRKSGRPRTVFSQAVQASVKSLPVNPPWLHTGLTNLNCCIQAWAEISVTFWRWSRQEKSFPSYSFRLISLLSLLHWWNPKLQK